MKIISVKAKFAFWLVLIVFALNFLAAERVFAQSFNYSQVFYESSASGSFDDDEYEIFALVNGERRKRRLADLSWDDQLARLARRFSEQMARQNFFDHYDRDGKTVADRAKSAKIKNWRKIGENLFYCESFNGFGSLAVKGWMKSAAHRQNILDNSWTATGIGVAESHDGKIFVTQVFISR